jgi:F420-non-reducing hydrogenase iron-sulfur subunit
MSKIPSTVVFVCNWDGLSCIEAAAQKRLTFPASAKIVRVSCLSRVHCGLILKAFEFGANGVLLIGCDINACHFGIQDDIIDRNYVQATKLMGLLGLRQDKLALVRFSPGNATGFVKRISDFVNQSMKLNQEDKTILLRK